MSATKTLYEVLAAPAPKGVALGETVRTLDAKETVDADDEALFEVVLIGV